MKNPFENMLNQPVEDTGAEDAEKEIEEVEKEESTLDKLKDFARKGDLKRAEEFIESLELSSEEEAQQYYSLGELLIYEGFHPEAAEVAEKFSFEYRPYGDSLVEMLVKAYLQGGSASKAEELFKARQNTGFVDMMAEVNIKEMIEEYYRNK